MAILDHTTKSVGVLGPTAWDENSLRREVRQFVADEAAAGRISLMPDSWVQGYDADFSGKLGDRGWLGMTWPAEYGGHERSALDRFVVIEELLAAGAPVSAHWIADRQTGPLLLRFGTERQRDRHLPAICRGESYFCIGMSEPNSGSDLASIRTRAVRQGDGGLLNGHKLWTTNAHYSQFMIALVRTGEKTAARHEGMSQFVIDLRAPGVTVRPVRDLAGGEHFNEGFFYNVELDA